MTKRLLKFGDGNAKLFGIHTLSLPSGWSCPGANECLARVIKNSQGKRKLVRGKDSRFTCYQATLESIFPSLYDAVWHNFNLLKEAKTTEGMARLIHESLPLICRIIRIHVGGDFFSENYFKAWIIVARNNPNIIFYGYTKSIHLWKRLKHLIPSNFILTASKGGKFDNLIDSDTKTNEVVFSPEEAEEKGIPIDHDDSYAYSPEVKKFATLLHGKQEAGSDSAKALRELKKRNMGVYNKKKVGYVPVRKEFKMMDLEAVPVNKPVRVSLSNKRGALTIKNTVIK